MEKRVLCWALAALLWSTCAQAAGVRGDCWKGFEHQVERLAKADEAARTEGMSSKGSGTAEERRDARKIQAVDAKSAEFIRRTMAACGIPTKSAVGAEHAGMFMLLVVHATSDIALQRVFLLRAETLTEKGELPGELYAILSDKVALEDGRLQKYGTQLSREFKATDTEDRRVVNARRAKLGMMPLEEYEMLVETAFTEARKAGDGQPGK
jgi:hypothetical protein